MMSFMDELIDRAKYVAVKAGEKTGELVEISRLKLALAGLNHSLEKEFQNLGHVVYDMIKSERNNEELVFQCVDEIDGILAEIDEINRKLNDNKKNVCPSCQRVNLDAAKFCSFCGRPLDWEEEPMRERDCCCEEACCAVECCCEASAEAPEEEPLCQETPAEGAACADTGETVEENPAE